MALPRIMSAPLSWKDAQVILSELDGPEAPKAWQGAGLSGKGNGAYRVGGGASPSGTDAPQDGRSRPADLDRHGKNPRQPRIPTSLVIVGNHRDAWMYGGVDPVERFGGADGARAHARSAREEPACAPRRTILFASWDAEEFTLTSSTEWGEQHEQRARRECRRVPQRRQRGVGAEFRRGGGAGAQSADRRSRRRRSGIPWRGFRSTLPGAPATQKERGALPDRRRRRAGEQQARQRVRLHGVPQFPRHSDRGPVLRRPVRRLPLHLRQPSLGLTDRRSRLPLPRGDGADLGAARAAPRERGRAAARLRAYTERDRGIHQATIDRPLRDRARAGAVGGRESARDGCGSGQREDIDGAQERTDAARRGSIAA